MDVYLGHVITVSAAFDLFNSVAIARTQSHAGGYKTNYYLCFRFYVSKINLQYAELLSWFNFLIQAKRNHIIELIGI